MHPKTIHTAHVRIRIFCTNWLTHIFCTNWLAHSTHLQAHQSALRAKDKELSAAQHKLQWAAQIETRNGELENRLLALKKELDDAHSEMRTLQTVRLCFLHAVVWCLWRVLMH